MSVPSALITATAPHPAGTPVRHRYDLSLPQGVVTDLECDDPDYLNRVLWAGTEASTLEWPDELNVTT